MSFKNIIEKIRPYIRFKVYLQRTNSYLTIINSSMLVFLMLSRVRDLGFNFNLWLVFPPALLLFIGGLMLVGYIDVTYGLLAQEQEVQGRKHPIFKEIRDMIRELDRKIERLNKQ